MLNFTGLVLSASEITPTMTLILLHASTPCILTGSNVFFPSRKHSLGQVRGGIVISMAVIICLIRPMYLLVTEDAEVFALSSITYVISASLQGVSTLYKENMIVKYSHTPTDIYYMSAQLFLLQTLLTLLLSPLIFSLQS